jgi:signal transduction histidine kinase
VDIVNRAQDRVVDHVPSGLFTNPRVTCLVQDGRNRIWMSTFAGIIGFDPGTRAYIKLGRENGLINSEFNIKSSALLPDGRIIFGGLNGYDILQPADFDFAMMKPEGQFTGYSLISTTDTTFSNFDPEHSDRLEFNVDKKLLRIYLSAKDRPDAALYRYEYNLDGANWIPVKGTPFIDLFNLEPDDYSLQVRAYDEFGTLITFPPLTVTASVPFIKSRAFIRVLLVVMVLLAALYIFMLLHQRKREQDLKEKIAMDLHDEVGTILTRTLYLTRATRQIDDKSRVEQFLNEALYSLRAYINTMNRSGFTLGQLRDELVDLLQTTFRTAGYEVDTEFEADLDIVIHAELYRDIKLSVYEIMNNTIRHANGSRFRFKLSQQSGKLYLSTSDNGILRDVAQLQDKGNGMRNLVKRVRRHQGQIHFTVNPEGHGFNIDMTMPLGS